MRGAGQIVRVDGPPAEDEREALRVGQRPCRVALRRAAQGVLGRFMVVEEGSRLVVTSGLAPGFRPQIAEDGFPFTT